jgi:hypothetical protein
MIHPHVILFTSLLALRIDRRIYSLILHETHPNPGECSTWFKRFSRPSVPACSSVHPHSLTLYAPSAVPFMRKRTSSPRLSRRDITSHTPPVHVQAATTRESSRPQGPCLSLPIRTNLQNPFLSAQTFNSAPLHPRTTICRVTPLTTTFAFFRPLKSVIYSFNPRASRIESARSVKLPRILRIVVMCFDPPDFVDS